MRDLNGRIIYSVGHSNHEADNFVKILQGFSIDAVSYTHLTLPTILLV